MRPVLVFDSEVFINWTLFYFRNIVTREEFRFEHPMDLEGLKTVIREHRLVTFNGTGYDIPILMLALKGATAAELKAASNRIIVHNLKPWNFEKEFGVKLNPRGLDHVDLMDVAPMTGSLKLYGARMHSRFIQELPLPHETVVTPEQIQMLTEYCSNDLETTEDLYRTLKEPLELREAMSAKYQLDLRSKSDAQIAEAVIKKEVEKLKGVAVVKSDPSSHVGNKFKYLSPAWVKLDAIDILPDVLNADFIVNDSGKVVIPSELSGRDISIGGTTYRMGIGGLHSKEQSRYVEADEDHLLMDFDVRGYYPEGILRQGLFPPNMGPEFMRVFRFMVNDRVKAKLEQRSSDAASLKIITLACFGKMGSRWSVLYHPPLVVQVTVTGQLILLMIIETFVSIPGVEVISCNTDGVTVRCHKDSVPDVLSAVKEWESITGFVMERTDYRGIYSRDVNNYVAVLTNGDVKSKGVYGKGLPLQKNPVATICSRAVIDYLTLGASIRGTVEASEDMREFVCVRSVTGGALYKGEYVGKVVRWYYTISTETFTVKLNGNKVPKTDGAKPCMVLPLLIPEDLDREWYVKEAESMLADMGVAV